MAEHGDRRCPDSDKACLTRKLAEHRARNRRRLHGERVGAYICRACGFWHIGHTPVGSPRKGLRRAR